MVIKSLWRKPHVPLSESESTAGASFPKSGEIDLLPKLRKEDVFSNSFSFTQNINIPVIKIPAKVSVAEKKAMNRFLTVSNIPEKELLNAISSLDHKTKSFEFTSKKPIENYSADLHITSPDQEDLSSPVELCDIKAVTSPEDVEVKINNVGYNNIENKNSKQDSTVYTYLPPSSFVGSKDFITSNDFYTNQLQHFSLLTRSAGEDHTIETKHIINVQCLIRASSILKRTQSLLSSIIHLQSFVRRKLIISHSINGKKHCVTLQSLIRTSQITTKHSPKSRATLLTSLIRSRITQNKHSLKLKKLTFNAEELEGLKICQALIRRKLQIKYFCECLLQVSLVECLVRGHQVRTPHWCMRGLLCELNRIKYLKHTVVTPRDVSGVVLCITNLFDNLFYETGSDVILFNLLRKSEIDEIKYLMDLYFENNIHQMVDNLNSNLSIFIEFLLDQHVMGMVLTNVLDSDHFHKNVFSIKKSMATLSVVKELNDFKFSLGYPPVTFQKTFFLLCRSVSQD
ncbi:myosin [Acrasis kona]|uniref:Myosin n=1 Tax=Acrasis kona TaxID=1008807 RepID=A0AAW2Z0P4_9EUKA